MKLEPAEAEVLAADAAAFAAAIPDLSARSRFDRLAVSARSGELAAELIPALEAMLELLFAKGRPSNRAVLQSIFARTPRGRQQTIAAREVSKALRTLRGQQLETLRLTAGPGGHTLVVETDRCKLTVELDSAGARVASLETG